MTAQLVIDALMLAIWQRGKPVALLHHSDQGSQYAAKDFPRLLADRRIACGINGNGECWDNSSMESFFSSLKMECTNRTWYCTRDQARADVFDYVEWFYYPRRRHLTLGPLVSIS